MSRIDELLAQQKALSEELEKIKLEERDEVLKEIKEKIKLFNFKTSDFKGVLVTRKKTQKKTVTSESTWITRPRRLDNTARLGELKRILSQLENNQIIQSRKLKTWLTPEEYQQYESSWQQQLELRKQLSEKPVEVSEYEAKLKRAIFAYNKAEAASARKSAAAQKLYHKAETLFERTLEYLDEIINADIGLTVWFDRHLDFSAGGSLGADPINIPRVVTSRSLDASNNGLMLVKRSKQQLKIEAIQIALAEMEHESDDSGDHWERIRALKKRFNLE